MDRFAQPGLIRPERTFTSDSEIAEVIRQRSPLGVRMWTNHGPMNIVIIRDNGNGTGLGRILNQARDNAVRWHVEWQDDVARFVAVQV